jgi:hypothetical protein
MFVVGIKTVTTNVVLEYYHYAKRHDMNKYQRSIWKDCKTKWQMAGL